MYKVNKPVFSTVEMVNLIDCIKRGWISNGPKVREFEREFAEYCGKKYAVACSSATAGLHLALKARGVDKNWTIVLPVFTMIAPAFAVYYTGAQMQFVDAELDTWCMDIEKMPDKYDAVMPVHIYGHPVLQFPVDNYVVEDCAEALGTQPIGWGDVQVYSFYVSKVATCGEGGMVVTDDEEIANRVASLRNMAFGAHNKYMHHEIGYNYRMTDLQAAVGLAQLSHIPERVNKKRMIAGWYNQRLQQTQLRLPTEKEWASNSYWMYGIVLPRGMDRDKVQDDLYAMGVETRPFFYPMHLQPCFGPLGKPGDFPIAEYLADYGLSLPTGVQLEEKDVESICEAVRKVL